MLQVIYPLGFIVSLSGLILWFYYQDNPQRSRLMSSAFLGGFMIYLFSLAFSDGTLSTKLWVLFRDLMVLGVVSQGFNFIRRNTILFFGALGLLYYVFYAFGFQRMSQSLTEAPSRLSTEANFYGELLVDMVEGKDLEQLDRVLAAYGATRYQRAFQPERADQTELDDYLVLDLPDTEVDRIADLEKDLLNSGLVDWVEENERIQLDPLEQVPSLRRGISYGINDPAVDQLWGFEAMKVNELYDLLRKQEVRPQRKALIAILDTGIDAAHEDLAANYKSIARKHDSDPQGHGTHCAGIAASVSNNKKGVASFSLQNDFVEVASVRVLGAYGGGTQQSIIKGIIEAADRGADVISMSLGGPSNRQRQRAYEQAIRYANKAGAIVVAAAGNSNANAANYSPANAPSAITVSAVDTNLNRASFSNYVTDVNQGIAAPCVQIYSTIPKNRYAAFNGTSMATPYVAGLLGLLKSIQPDLTTKQAYKIINSTGADTQNTAQTGKLIQPAAAVKALLQQVNK